MNNEINNQAPSIENLGLDETKDDNDPDTNPDLIPEDRAERIDLKLRLNQNIPGLDNDKSKEV